MRFSKSKRKAAPKRTSNRALSLMLERTLIDEARSDKDLLLRMALKARGHADMARAIEEAKRPKNILNAKVGEIAIKKLDDPAYAEPLIEDFIRSAFGHSGGPDTGEDFNYPPNRGDTACTPAQQLIGQMNDIDELKERLGIPAGRPGVLSKLLTPDVVTGVLGLVKVMITKDSTPQAPVRTYIIDMGGQLCGVSEHEYKKLVETGQIKEVGMLTAPPKIERPPSPATPSAPKVDEPPIIESLAAKRFKIIPP
jgi:hypothetical protein